MVDIEFDDKGDPIPAKEPEVVLPAPPSEDVLIDVMDDTPPEDRGRPPRKDGEEPQIPSDEEIASYSDGVQKRIKQLRYEFHQERRAKEEMARQTNAALDYARRVADENAALAKRYADGEVFLKEQMGQKVQASLESAREKYKKAYELGDITALAAAQEEMARFQAEKIRVEEYRPQPPRVMPPPQAPAPPRDYKVEAWVAKNPWFLKDDRMTSVVMEYQERIQREDGVDPRSDEYYQKIDSYMRKSFPSAFQGEAPSEVSQVKPPPTVVAPASRSPATKQPRKITLTKSQVDVCRKLGVSPEDYARQLLKDKSNV